MATSPKPTQVERKLTFNAIVEPTASVDLKSVELSLHQPFKAESPQHTTAGEPKARTATGQKPATVKKYAESPSQSAPTRLSGQRSTMFFEPVKPVYSSKAKPKQPGSRGQAGGRRS